MKHDDSKKADLQTYRYNLLTRLRQILQHLTISVLTLEELKSAWLQYNPPRAQSNSPLAS